jgi:ATP-binding cassette subfamily B protein|tara:strand:+ start:16257 stop:18134 length:1878 start_codon:yes stop_codon:yes gene_type:complete
MPNGHHSAQSAQYTANAPRRADATFRDLGHLQRLFPYLRRYAWALAATIFGFLLTRLFDAAVPLFLKLAVDSISDGDPKLLLPAAGIIATVICRYGVFVYARRLMRRIAIAVCYDLRKRLFKHIQKQGPAFFNVYPTGDIMSRAINDINLVRNVIAWGVVSIMTFLFSVSIAMVFMFYLSPTLSLMVIWPLPIVAYVAFRMSRILFPYIREQMMAIGEVTSYVQENLNGIRTIQAMAQEEAEIKRFTAVSTKYADLVYRATKYRAIMNVIMPMMTTILPVIIIGYGGSLVLSGDISVGTFVAFFSYLLMLTGPVRMIGMSLSMLTMGAAGTARLFEVFDYEPEINDDLSAEVPDRIQGHVEIRNLTYTYPGAHQSALTDISIDIEPGETIAFLGRVGCGKSTLLKSLVRLIDTPADTVLLDGHDIRRFPLERLRKDITLILQDPFLFSDTLRLNVTYDDPSRQDKPIWAATDAASMSETIREFPLQLATIVGERGITLSGGQKQRATLARGLIRRAPVLAMDDCFSSVDTETEEEILSGLQRLRKGKTTLLISHRVSTVRHADRIFVIDEGRVLESGTHEELLDLGGYYADLEAIQSNQDQDRQRKAKLLQDLEDEEEVLVGGDG